MATGTYKVGEADKKFEQRNVTSTFYRLEKKFNGAFPYYDVYEFYKVRNGNMYCRHHEESIYHGERKGGHIYKNIEFGFNNYAKEKGNKKYQELLDKGYKFAGVFECDICGYAKRIK